MRKLTTDRAGIRWTDWRRSRIGFCLCFIGLVSGVTACEKPSDQPVAVRAAAADALPGVLHLTQEELARTTLEVSPVGRGQLAVPREFTATVQSNENELAEVTTDRKSTRLNPFTATSRMPSSA